MSTRIIEYGKTKFVCGLFWQSLSRPRELKREAVELAKKIRFDLMILHKDHGTAQAGYAQAGEGAQAGMPSLAAAVAAAVATQGAHYDGQRQPANSWLGAFALPDGSWAYFAVRDENFLPNGDFTGSKAEVLERLQGDYGLGGWNVVIGEQELEEHGFHNFSASRLEDLLPLGRKGQVRVHKDWMLRPVTRKLPWKALAIGGAAAGVAAVALWMYWQHLQKVKAEQERARLAELARQGKGAHAIPHPWPDKPLPQTLADACRPDLRMLTPGGWTFKEFVCTATGASYTWARGSSAVGYLLDAVPQASVDLTGEQAGFLQPHKLAAGRDEKLQPSRDLLMTLLTKFQAAGLTLQIANAPASPATPLPGMEKNGPPAPDWKTYALSVNGAGLPAAEIGALLAEPGVRIEKLTYRDNEWTIEGVAYAK